MNRPILCVLLVGTSLLAVQRDLQAQGFGGGSGTGGLGTPATAGAGRGAGLTQTGELSSTAAITRDPFVGRSLGWSPRSLEGQQPSSINAGFASNLGTGLGGRGGLGGGLGGGFGGGLGGIGGGLGGLGGGLGGLGGGLGGGRGGFGGGLGGGFGGGLGGQFGGNQFGGNQFGAQGGQTTRQTLRAKMTIGFEVSPRPANVVSARFEKRLTSIPRLKILTPVKVTMEKETAVLRGTVARERDRDLIARLALLEPGISNVRNQLIVAPEDSTSGQPN